MIPAKYNMVCPQGSTFTQRLSYAIDGVPVNLSSYSVRMQVRERHSSTNVIVSLSSIGDSPNITLIEDEGVIDIYISALTTADIYPKEYVYDIELVTGSEVTRILEGKFIVTAEVTR